MKLTQEEYIKDRTSLGGFLVITFLGIIGALLVYHSNIFGVHNKQMLYDCIAKNGLMIVFGLFFFIMSLYSWILLFLNVFEKPKKEIAYLLKLDTEKAVFVNKKGKKFDYVEVDNLKESCYYYVLKTRNFIHEVLEETNDTWKAIKSSYWLNLYSPVGNFENILVLPILYVILVPAALSFFMSKGLNKVYGILFGIVPLYIIIYDLIYKNKLRNSEKGDTKLEDSPMAFNIIIKIFATIVIGILGVKGIGFFLGFITITDVRSKIIMGILFVMFLCVVGVFLSSAFEQYKLKKVFLQLLVIVFLISWFIIIGFCTVMLVRQEGNNLYSLVSVPFVCFGVLIAYIYFVKKN